MAAHVSALTALVPVIGVADVVALDEIHAPGGVQRNDGIIVRLPGPAVPEAVHIRVPAANGGRVRRPIRRDLAAQDRPVVVGGDAGNAPHDVDAEFQAQTVDVVRQRLEPRAARAAGEPLRVRQQPGVPVHLHLAEGNILVRLPHGPGLMGVPLDIHHHVFPAEGLQFFRQDGGVGPHLFLGNGGVVVVVAVPPHGRDGGEGILSSHSVSRFPIP